MTLKRMDNVSIVVKDIDAMVAFFQELGMTLVGETTVEGEWVDRVIAVKGSKSRIAMLQTPDGHSRIELAQFLTPAAVPGDDEKTPANALGIRRIMFAVEDIDKVVKHLESKGAKLMGEIMQYEDIYRLCYLRGPEGVMVGLAEELGKKD